MTSSNTSPMDDFNDLSQQRSNADGNGEDDGTPSNGSEPSSAPKKQRIACVLCRKRKLKCDGKKPSCGTCSRLGHDCAYDEVRKKSGPKRGYVRALEARLAQVETFLKTQEPSQPGNDNTPQDASDAFHGLIRGPQHATDLPALPSNGNITFANADAPGVMQEAQRRFAENAPPGWPQQPSPVVLPAVGSQNDDFSWEMIGLGLEEPLPAQDTIDELHQIYFDKVHPSVPFLHRARYFASMNLAPSMRPPVCLRYAMWCLAASVDTRYQHLQAHFYERARKYASIDEMKGHGETILTVAHTQCWSLIATYEFKTMYFPRAWLSCGKSSRMALMLGLHRLDGVGLDVKQCLAPPKDWTEREERRRTFWIAFCSDRYASIGTGWPMAIDEGDILTNLPASEEVFNEGRAVRSIPLKDAYTPNGAGLLSPFAGVVVMAALFGRNLLHLHRPDADDNDDDLNGAFWKRHRQIDNILLNTSLSLPDHLRLPTGLNNPNTVFLNMNIHASTICLHQAAIFKADKNRMPASVSSESKIRCITAAAEITSVMRMISHIDLTISNPFICFCLYVAARVFIQYLKSRPNDDQVKGSLQFLLTAMHALKRLNPLTESFLVQLEVDLEGSGLDTPTANSKVPYGLKKGVAEIHTGRSSGKNDRESSWALPSRERPVYGQDCGAGGMGAIFGDTESPTTTGLANRRPNNNNSGTDMDTSAEFARVTSLSDEATPGSQKDMSTGSSITGSTPPSLGTQSEKGTRPVTSEESSNPSFFSMSANTPFSPSQFLNVGATPGKELDNTGPFIVPDDWNIGGMQSTSGGTGMTPGASGVSGSSGMTPLNVGVWSDLLEGVGVPDGGPETWEQMGLWTNYTGHQL